MRVVTVFERIKIGGKKCLMREARYKSELKMEIVVLTFIQETIEENRSSHMQFCRLRNPT